MGRFIIRRLLQMIPVVFGATLILFVMLFALGNPIDSIGGERNLDRSVRQTIIDKYHLDDSLPKQYISYMGNLAKGDLGESILQRRPVKRILGDGMPWSLKLALTAIAIETFFGIVAGVISAVRRYSFLDVFTTIGTSVLVAIPVFWLGLMLQLLFGVFLRNTFIHLPVSGVDAGWRSFILPALTLASVFTAITARLTRTTMLEVMRQDYIRTAAAKGLPERTIVYKHALRNAMIPVITNIGLDFGSLIGGAILTETVFSWPGIGRELALAVLRKDNPIVIGGTIILIMAFLLVNLLVDISYGFLDPRIRYD
ncbi:MAG: ABC transporter permease [Actinomycetota bacterium]|nr:ABC transporter permease [Actinomycetota bacterium]